MHVVLTKAMYVAYMWPQWRRYIILCVSRPILQPLFTMCLVCPTWFFLHIFSIHFAVKHFQTNQISQIIKMFCEFFLECYIFRNKLKPNAQVKVKGICLWSQSFNHLAGTVSPEKETAHRFLEVMIENYWYRPSFDLNTVFLWTRCQNIHFSSFLTLCNWWSSGSQNIFNPFPLIFKSSVSSPVTSSIEINWF